MRLDAHQHFWKFDPLRHSWITEDMTALRKDFLPEHLLPLLQNNNIDGCISVQAEQSLEETHFLLKLAAENSFIKGVVGWVDLQAADIAEKLAYFSSFKDLKGFRHIVQSESDDQFLARATFCRGISLLKQYDFTYDILVYPGQLKSVLEFVQRFPDQPFVIDHMAKPDILNKRIWDWENDMTKISKCPNVYCKISGLVTEADVDNWEFKDFNPYINLVMEQFGPEKIMFGSDWPVCLLAADYREVCDIAEQNSLHLAKEDKKKMWGENAAKFYGIQ